MIDLIVVGAGPAGLMTAIHAATSGLETVVLDARSGPIDKACGEGLMPGALGALNSLGVQLRGQPIAGICYTRGQYRAEARFRSGPGAGVRRTELYAALQMRALQLGVRIEVQNAGTVYQDERSVTAAGFRARYLAAADGLHSPIRHQLKLDCSAHTARTTKRWGQRQHFALEPWTDLVEVHWGLRSELYVTPVGPNLVGVAVLGDEQRGFAQALKDFPAIAMRLPPVGESTVRGAGPLRQSSQRRVAGRVLLVGDAAGYIDALTGEGIAVAQACAAELVACVLSDQPQDYEARFRSACRRYRLLTESLLWARRRPLLNRALVPAARTAPWLFSAAVNQLAR